MLVNARVRVRLKDGQQQATVIHMAANSAARATNCHLINTLAMNVAYARIAATAKSRLRRHRYCQSLSHDHRHWHHRHHPDHQSLDPIHRDQ